MCQLSRNSEPQPPEALRACPGLYRDSLYVIQYQMVGRLEIKNMEGSDLGLIEGIILVFVWRE